jgi:hypothetical protein
VAQALSPQAYGLSEQPAVATAEAVPTAGVGGPVLFMAPGVKVGLVPVLLLSLLVAEVVLAAKAVMVSRMVAMVAVAASTPVATVDLLKLTQGEEEVAGLSLLACTRELEILSPYLPEAPVVPEGIQLKTHSWD